MKFLGVPSWTMESDKESQIKKKKSKKRFTKSKRKRKIKTKERRRSRDKILEQIRIRCNKSERISKNEVFIL